ncbi:MAG: CooT family nickel-binding protein [Deltaproteobacteria bacterium]|nr:MAG: CooT family nickel-binding protein [Deltaproteobacteria bacterium]
MCMNDGHFLLVQGDTETHLDDIAAILPAAGRLRLVDVLGKQREVTGSIVEIDLLNKRIVIG